MELLHISSCNHNHWLLPSWGSSRRCWVISVAFDISVSSWYELHKTSLLCETIAGNILKQCDVSHAQNTCKTQWSLDVLFYVSDTWCALVIINRNRLQLKQRAGWPNSCNSRINSSCSKKQRKGYENFLSRSSGILMTNNHGVITLQLDQTIPLAQNYRWACHLGHSVRHKYRKAQKTTTNANAFTTHPANRNGDLVWEWHGKERHAFPSVIRKSDFGLINKCEPHLFVDQ